MALQFNTKVLGLSKQLVTATGNNLYVNGLLIGSGVYATIDALTQTGLALELQLNSLSGWAASAANLAASGTTLYNDFAALSGNLITTGSLLSAVKVTGSAILPLANLTGLGGTQVFASGGYIVISGLSPVAGGVTSLNGLGGAVAVVGSGGLTVTVQGQNVIVSGDTSISGALTALSGQVGAISGVLQGQINTVASNLTATGASLGAQIVALSGFDTGISGMLQSQVNTLTTNLTQTGVLIEAQINGLSGVVGTASGALQTQITSVVTNLTQTGVTIEAQIAGLSGVVGTASGALQTSINAVSSNLTQTGVLIEAQINALSGTVGSVSGSLQTSINTVASNLTTTGQTLYALTTGFSGQSNLTFATIVNLALTGSNLYSVLTGLSGQANLNYATITNLALTGSNLYVTMTGLSGQFNVNLTLTGVAIEAQLASLSGYVGNASGALQVLINAVATNLTTTGQTLFLRDSVISGAISTGLGITGQTLYSYITSLSGAANLSYAPALANYLYQTGVRPPVHYVGPSNYTLTSGDFLVIATGSPTNVTGILPSATTYSGNLFILINNTSGPYQVSGVIGPDTNPFISPFDSIEAYATSGTWNYIRQTGAPGLVNALIGLSGYVGNASGALNTFINTLTTNLTLTGQSLFLRDSVISGAIGTGLTLTGQMLYNLVTGLSGSDATTYATIANLIASGALLSATKVTGSSIIPVANFTGLGGTLVLYSGGFVFISGAGGSAGGITQAQLDSVSGWTNSIFVHRTGAELVSGNKTFDVTQSGTRFQNTGYSQSYLEMAASGVTGYWSAAGNQYFRVNHQTGRADFLFAVVKNIGPGQQGLNDGTSFVVRSYSGDSTVGDPFPFDIFVGTNTGFGYGFIDVAHEGIGFIPLVLCPSAKDNDRVGVLNTNPLESLDVSGNIRASNGVFKSGATDITNLYYPRNSNPSGFITGFTAQTPTTTIHGYVLVTGNFTFTSGVERYLWSGSATGLSGAASNWATGTLPAASTLSGIDFVVKNIQTGIPLNLSGVIDFSQNYILGSMQSLTLGSNGSSWLAL